MKKSLSVFFYYICVFRTTSSYPFICPKNELMQRCKKPCQPTCQNPYVPRCSIFICKPGCVCKPGCIRDEFSGKCVNPQYCPAACPENEILNYGGNGCEPTCQNPYSKILGKRCICKSGLLRDESSGKCVPPGQCPKIPKCGRCEEWRDCSDLNCRDTCQRRKPKVCPTKCTPGCSCQNGFFWDEHLKQCVSKWQCSKVCGKNEDWYQQLPDDIPTCQNFGFRERRYSNDQSLNDPRPGCLCIKGCIWDEVSKECIRLQDCIADTTIPTNSSTAIDFNTTTPASSSSEASSATVTPTIDSTATVTTSSNTLSSIATTKSTSVPSRTTTEVASNSSVSSSSASPLATSESPSSSADATNKATSTSSSSSSASSIGTSQPKSSSASVAPEGSLTTSTSVSSAAITKSTTSASATSPPASPASEAELTTSTETTTK